MKTRRDDKHQADRTQHRLWGVADEASDQQRPKRGAQTTGHIEYAHTHRSSLEDTLSKEGKQNEESTADTGTPGFHRQQAQDIRTRTHIAHTVPEVLPAIAWPADG